MEFANVEISSFETLKKAKESLKDNVYLVEDQKGKVYLGRFDEYVDFVTESDTVALEDIVSILLVVGKTVNDLPW
jgi:hypothetical protein